MSAPAGWEGPGGPARSRAAVPVLLGLLVVVAVGVLLRGDPEAPVDAGLRVEPAEPIDAGAGGGGADGAGADGGGVDGAERGSPALPELGGRWQALEAAPLVAPRRHRAVWTGEELVAFGAFGEVAAYDARQRLWRQRDPIPVQGERSGPPALREPSVDPVWTGAEVLVLTGPTTDARDAAMPAAAFDPRAGTWRTLPSPPVAVVPPAVSVWTGEEWVVWGRGAGPRVREDGPPVGSAFDPSTGRWRRLPEPPIMLVDGVGGTATDRSVVVWGQRPGPDLRARGEGAFALRYLPEEDRWEGLEAPPLADPAKAIPAWTGSCAGSAPGADGCDEVLLWGAAAAGLPPEAAPAGGARLDVVSGRWTPLPSVPGLAGRGDWAQAAAAEGTWAGGRLLVVGGTGAVGLGLDRAGRWASLPERPPLLAPVLAWTGEELLVWGGYGPGGSTPALRAWRPPSPASLAGDDATS